MKTSRVLTPEEFDDYVVKIRAGENIGGVLWLGIPAETVAGQGREATCMYSELNKYGAAWLDLARCLKQIVVSCDGCFRNTGHPYYKSQ